MLLDCMICTEMCGNGAKMVGMKTMKMRQPMEVVGMRIILKIVLDYCAAVLGSAIRGAVARLFGTGTMRSSGSAATVFGLLFALSRIPYPFYFYSFSLFPLPGFSAAVGT